jgi:hypothetical protein
MATDATPAAVLVRAKFVNARDAGSSIDIRLRHCEAGEHQDAKR